MQHYQFLKQQNVVCGSVDPHSPCKLLAKSENSPLDRQYRFYHSLNNFNCLLRIFAWWNSDWSNNFCALVQNSQELRYCKLEFLLSMKYIEIMHVDFDVDIVD